jgi:geranylgeranylglycerol-phosphate geranylgeranyltransferase
VNKLASYLELTRPLNNLITVVAVFMGAWIAGLSGSLDKLFFALISAFLISAGGYVINDYFDLEIDKINKPSRPLPQGNIRPSYALFFSVILFLAGIILSFFIKEKAFFIAVTAAILLFLYSLKLKRTPLFGNLLVSLVCGLAFIYGGLVGMNVIFSLIPAGFAFLFHLGREILKDIEDLKGDVSSGAKTLPVVSGINISLLLTTIVFSGLIFLTIIPYYFKIFPLLYLIIVLFVDLLLIYVTVSMWKDQSKKNLGMLSRILKLGMILGLVAIFVVRL